MKRPTLPSYDKTVLCHPSVGGPELPPLSFAADFDLQLAQGSMLPHLFCFASLDGNGNATYPPDPSKVCGVVQSFQDDGRVTLRFIGVSKLIVSETVPDRALLIPGTDGLARWAESGNAVAQAINGGIAFDVIPAFLDQQRFAIPR